MSYFEAKLHQIRFRLELCYRPSWGSLRASADLAGFQVSILQRERQLRVDDIGAGRGGAEKNKMYKTMLKYVCSAVS